ncbi:MAG: hypothetical protein HQM06_01530 [Magnetococcales bacterium]|nr:hypothetical protein [Magnetococcales bacterium]
MALPRIEQLVQLHSGLTFQGERKVTLERAVQERMEALAVRQLANYAEKLSEESREREQLISLLTVNETYFMREPVQIRYVVDRLVPELINRYRMQKKIVILSAGCATGEEPYSLAISLVEKYAGSVGQLIEIIGIDVDVKALSIAKEGLYGRNAFRGLPHSFPESHFAREADLRYRIKEQYRQLVTFQNCNILNQQDILKLAIKADIIFYRNVSIYFDEPARRTIFNHFSSILQDPGYVVVGSVESLLHDFGVLHLLEDEGLFFFQKGEPKSSQKKGWLPPPPSQSKKRQQSFLGKESANNSLSLPRLPHTSSVLPASISQRLSSTGKSPGSKQTQSGIPLAIDLAQQQNYPAALSCLEKEVAQENLAQNCQAHALQAAVFVEMQRYSEAKEVCQLILRHQSWHIEARMLLGVIAKRQADHEQALQQFKEVCFLSPHNWLAHYYMAEAYLQLACKPQAVRSYRVTANILRKDGMSQTGLTLFAPFCSTEQLLHVCNKQIVQLMV